MKQGTLNQIADPVAYFEGHPLDESQVLRFWYDRDEEVLELVIAYAHEFLEERFAAGSQDGKWKLQHSSSPDCFQRFVFSDVRYYVRRGVARIYNGDVIFKISCGIKQRN